MLSVQNLWVKITPDGRGPQNILTWLSQQPHIVAYSKILGVNNFIFFRGVWFYDYTVLAGLGHVGAKTFGGLKISEGK